MRRTAAALLVLALPLAPLPTSAGAGQAAWVEEDLGGAPASPPSVASDGERRWVYFLGQNGHVWSCRRELGAPFDAPVDLGIAAKGAPSALVLGVDRLRLFFRAPDDHLSYADGDGRAFGAAVDLGGDALTSSPSAVLRRDGHQAVFYRGPAGHLEASLWDGGPWWSAPYDLSVEIASAPSAVVPPGEPDHLRVFYALPGGDLGESAWEGTGWRQGTALAGAGLRDGVGVAASPGETSVLLRGSSGELARTTVGGAAPTPAPTGLFATSAPALLSADEAYEAGTDGHLHRARLVPAVASPRYNEVYGIATHNSYWINRDHRLDPFASGTQELLSDQLLHEHARALELDVHTDDGHPGQWSIYHTDRPDFSQVHTLADAVELLRNFHYALPRHEVVNVVIELKNTNLKAYPPLATANTFDAEHTIEQFDRTFRDGLGEALYTPRDLLARCAPGGTLARAARVAGWPTTEELRGRFIVNVIGNWSNAYHDWYRYANEGNGVADRVAFPLRSMLDRSGRGIAGWPGDAHDHVPSSWVQPAHDASVFWQAEALDHPELPAFLARNGVVRGGDSFDVSTQQDRLRRGFQLIQTDYPWDVIDDAGPAGAPTNVGQRFRDPAPWTGRPPIDPEALLEPGERLYGSTDDRAKLLYGEAPAGSVRWLETTVSTTRAGDTWGLSYPRAAQERGVGGLEAAVGKDDWVAVLRSKTSQPGDSKLQEKVTVSVLVCRGGVVTSHDRVASLQGPDAVGSLVALWVDTAAAGGGSVVRAFSAGRLAASGRPDWQLLREERFAGPARYQGVVFSRDVLFVGSRLVERGAGERPLGTGDLPWITGSARVWDLSYPRHAGAAPGVRGVP